MSFKGKIAHEPAAIRQIGFTAWKFYALGGLASLIYIFIISSHLLDSKLDFLSKPSLTAADRQFLVTYKTQWPQFIKEQRKNRSAQKATPALSLEEQATLQFPDPVMPSRLTKPKQTFVTDPTKMREAQQAIFRWEKYHNKSFLRDHPTMQPINKTRFDYIQKTIIYINLDKNAPSQPSETPEGTEEVIEDIQPIRGVWAYDSPQLWEVDVDTSIAGFYLYKTFNTSTEQITGRHVYNSHSGNGLCYAPVKPFIRDYERYENMFKVVGCGQVWRDFISLLYKAKTDEELLYADPINMAVRQTNIYTQMDKKNYEAALLQVQREREEWLTANRPQPTQAFLLDFTDPAIKKRYQDLQNRPEKLDKIRFFLLSGAFVALAVYMLLVSPLAPIRVGFIPPNFWILPVGCFAAYVGSFYVAAGHWSDTFWSASLIFLLPLGFMTYPIWKVALWEMLKETHWFQSWFIIGRHGEASRWAGILKFTKMDMSDYFSKNRTKIQRTETSDIYLGKTRAIEDIRIGGRHVGFIDRQQHLLTVAQTGAGKGRDVLFNNVLSYSGGIISFDPKGEMFRICHQRRRAYAPLYLIDPFRELKDIQESNGWNPLAEIDPNKSGARERLNNLAAASIYSEGITHSNSDFFEKNAQTIVRGYMAHVLTKYPPEQQHLGTVYNLMKRGVVNDGIWDKKACMQVILEMATNTALGGAPKDASDFFGRDYDPKMVAGLMATITKGLEWVKSPDIFPIISQQNSFSLAEAKTKEASIFLCLPTKFINTHNRFLRTFYTMAADKCDNHSTPQPIGSKRRVLFIFDEFNALGHFEPAEELANIGRGSFIKCWFICQNLGQVFTNYPNQDNIITNCDMQLFGIHRADSKAKELAESLGSFIQKDGGGQHFSERGYQLLTASEMASLLDFTNPSQLLIPAGGFPIILNRVHYDNNYSRSQYGHHHY